MSATPPPRPLASVIVVTYNSADVIVDCLRALQAQDLPEAYEVVVVDNGSRDGTPDLVRAHFPDVALTVGANVGFGAGNNAGARLAKGHLLAFVNPDTRAEPGWLRSLVEPLRAGPGTVTTSKILLLGEPGRVNTGGNLCHFTGLCFTNGYRRSSDAFREPVEVPAISGAAFAMRREDYERLGGFDEDFFLYMEDTDLSWRARRAGMRVLLVPGSVVHHRYELRLTAGKLYHVEKGRVLLLRKHFRGRDWALLAPSLALAELLAWGQAVRLGREGFRAKARAVAEGWRMPVRRSSLPPLRLASFAVRRIPRDGLPGDALTQAAGACVNALFVLNTLGWGLRNRKAQGPGA